jgi:hypothetical protein
MIQKTKKSLIYPISLFLIVCILIILPEIKPASAHISRTFGEYAVEVGWNDEPVYESITNSLLVEVTQGSGHDAKPVINALKDIQISVKYGTVTKQMDFLPSAEGDGIYLAPIIPTRVGTYSMILKGNIQGQDVDTEIPLDDVSDIDMLNFPLAAKIDTSYKIDDVTINQLAQDVIETSKISEDVRNAGSKMENSIQELKNSTDLLYMINMAAIGIGISGIVIATFAIKKNI